MTEIILLCMSATITLGLSINTIIQNNRKDRELKDKQQELLSVQKKVSEQSEEIIKLQRRLQKQSDVQIENLNRLNNPVPKELELTFSTKIDVSIQELEVLSNVSKSNSNLLPSLREDTGVTRIDKLKDVQIIIDIQFKKGSKELNIKYSQAAFPFMGYSTGLLTGVGTIVAGEDGIGFYAMGLPTTDIKTNYPSPSLIDFYNSEVTVTFTFAYARPSRNGGQFVNMYLVDEQNQISLNLESISLETNQHTIDIDNFRKLEKNKFRGKWKN